MNPNNTLPNFYDNFRILEATEVKNPVEN